MPKKPPPKAKPRRERRTFFLLREVSAKLLETAERLDVPQSRVLEVLVKKHADALQVRVE